MAEEAGATLEKAKESEPRDPKVDECSAEIIQRNQAESTKEAALLETTRDKREVFCPDGMGAPCYDPSSRGSMEIPVRRNNLVARWR
jgi:hypothetical protein